LPETKLSPLREMRPTKQGELRDLLRPSIPVVLAELG
jgi:hypothetical protein